MEVRVAGENSLIVYLGDKVDPVTLARVRYLSDHLSREFPLEVIDLIPGYHSVVVVYDPRRIRFATLKRHILDLDIPAEAPGKGGKIVRLPVYYSDATGPDLERIARLHDISPEQVIDIHSAGEYLVYAIGFAPGFAYLGEVDQRIATPRHATPRLRVPAGAVAIADGQSAVYPADSPGGWNLIGRCPLPMFEPEKTPTTPWEVGDRVRFYAIDRDRFLELGGTL